MESNMEYSTDKDCEGVINENFSVKKIDVEMVLAKPSCLEDEKYNLMQTVDLSDLAFSSFNDIILGDGSYFEDEPVCGSGDVDKLADTSQPNTASVNTILKDCLQSVNLSVDNNSNQTNTLIKNDSYNFYHVIEVIGNPVTHIKETDCHTEKNPDCKTNKTSSNKKKKRLMTGTIKKGRRYLPNFKQKVLDYASNHTFRATALHFNINCNTITEWAREKKRLSQQQKSTMSMPDSVCLYKTETTNTPPSKTDNINNSFMRETEFSDELKKIDQDLPLGDLRSDERFLMWIKKKRNEGKELCRNEVYYAAQYCLKGFMSTCEHPAWFVLWVKRFERDLQCAERSDHETEKYIMYSNIFKLEVALYAKMFTKNSAARAFNVPRRRIFDWFKSTLNVSSKDICTNSGLTLAMDMNNLDKKLKKEKSKSQIYIELHDWYQKRYSEGFSPNSKEIKMKAKELFMANGIEDIKFSEGWLQKFCKRLNIKLRHNCDDHLLLWVLAQFDNNVSLSHQDITEKSSKVIGTRKEFKGSKGWTLRFLKRHSRFLQQVPTVADKLPDIVKNEIDKFCSYFRFAVDSYKISAISIGCMDEIPIGFNCLQDSKTSSLPLLRKTGFENCQAVVFLCALADGRLLPPAVVLRGSGPRQVLSDGKVDILLLYHEKGAVDFDIIDSWLEEIWLSYVPSPSILIVDSFKPHCSAEISKRLAADNCILSVIPGGCSSQLQPLDIEVTPKFKDLIREQWRELPPTDVVYSTKMSRRSRCPDQETIVKWIRTAYSKVEENPMSIIESFKVTGLIN